MDLPHAPANVLSFNVEVEDLPVGVYSVRVAGSVRATLQVTTAGRETEVEFRNPAEPHISRSISIRAERSCRSCMPASWRCRVRCQRHRPPPAATVVMVDKTAREHS
jgi:hypothetical protein